MSKTYNLYDIVMKLNGPINPLGETRADEKRLENIKQLTDLVDNLLAEISYVARSANDERASVKAIGQRAKKFLANVGNEYYEEEVAG